jgi:hypothetical protein
MAVMYQEVLTHVRSRDGLRMPGKMRRRIYIAGQYTDLKAVSKRHPLITGLSNIDIQGYKN